MTDEAKKPEIKVGNAFGCGMGEPELSNNVEWAEHITPWLLKALSERYPDSDFAKWAGRYIEIEN